MKLVIGLAILILIAGIGGFFAFNSSISQIGGIDTQITADQRKATGGTDSSFSDQGDSESSLSSMNSAMPRATRVDPDLDIYKLMGIRQVTEDERKAYQDEMKQNRQENEGKEDEPLEIKIKKVAPGKYQMTDEGLKPLDPNDQNPGVIMVVPEPDEE